MLIRVSIVRKLVCELVVPGAGWDGLAVVLSNWGVEDVIAISALALTLAEDCMSDMCSEE